MEPNDSEAEERDGVLGAENAFVVQVDVEEFVERLDVANAAGIGAGPDDAVETGGAPRGAGRVPAKRAGRRSDGPNGDLAPADARNAPLDPRAALPSTRHR